MGIQEAFTGAAGAIAGAALVGEKLNENERQANEKASEEAQKAQDAEAKKAEKTQRQLANDTLEAKDIALEADLIRMGADPESASAFMTARRLGLETKGFGMLRKKGKFVGSYSSVAEKLSKDALTDSLSSRAINDRSFTQRLLSLGGSRKSKVQALVEASGGKK